MDAPPSSPDSEDSAGPAGAPPPAGPSVTRPPAAHLDQIQLELDGIREEMDGQAEVLQQVYAEKQNLVASLKDAQLGLEQQKRLVLRETDAAKSPRQMALLADRPGGADKSLPALDEVASLLEQARIGQMRLSALERKAEAANRCVQEARRRLDRQEEDLKSLRQGTGRSEQALISQMEKMRAELRDATRQISESNRKLALREEEYRALQQRATGKEQTLNKQVASLKEQLAVASTGVARPERPAAQAGTKNLIDKDQLDTIRRQAAKREEALQQEIEQLRSELETALNAMEAVKQQIGAFRQEHLAQQSEFEGREAELEARVTALDADLARARHDCVVQETRAEDLARQLADQEQRWGKQQAALEQRLQRAESSGEDREARERRIAELQDALTRERRQREEQAAAAQAEQEHLRNLNADLVASAQAQREEFRVLSAQLKRREEALMAEVEKATGKPYGQRRLFETLSGSEPSASPRPE